MASMTRVFVYGTLKKGLPNHRLLQNIKKDEVANFLSNARSTERYPLVIATPAFIPFLLDFAGQGEPILFKQITGEVYEVCDKTLAKLDDLEDVGVLYDRKKIAVALTDANFNEESIDAFAYIMNNYKKDLLALDFISNYTEEHAKLYTPKHDRTASDILKYVKDV